MESKRLSIIVQGMVQGVGFRYFTRNVALKIGLSGWVRNLYDGRVEIEAQGSDEQLMIFISEVRTGPPMSRVEGFHMTEIALKESEIGFVILH
jgi:acylphosphatase